MSRAPKILLLDSNALVHRSYHALPPLTSPKGEMVNAVYGFAAALLKAIQDEKPDYVVACYDVGGDRETFRSQIYADYKAHRKESDQALYLQIPRTKDLVKALNIPLYERAGFEADDLIGSLCRVAAEKGLQAVIVTGDNDALQLVNDSTSVYSLRRGVTDTLSYNRALVKEKLGVYPNQVIDYKALAGDSSDNIPGAPGIGPKTAADWLSKYETLDGVYQHLAELSERQQRILTEYKEQVLMSQKLAAIKTDIPIELKLKEADIHHFDFTQAVSFFHEYGFKSLLTKLPTAGRQAQGTLFQTEEHRPGEASIEAVAPQLPFEAVTDRKRWQELMKIITAQEKIVFDTETVDLDGELIGIAFAWGPNEAAYLPVGPLYPGALPLKDLLDDLKRIFGDKTIKKIGHNLKYDVAALRRAGIAVDGLWFDTLLASQLINTQLFSHKLDDLAFSELGFKKIAISELIGEKKKAPMTTVPLSKLAAYSCEDALITWRLFDHFYPHLEEKSLKRVFYEIEMPLVGILERMEAHGIQLDTQQLIKLGAKLRGNLATLEKKIHTAAGREFNISSPAQLQVILYQELKLPVVGIKKVQSGHSTDVDALQKLKATHPIIPLLMEYREMSKLLNTYVDTLPRQVDQQGRLHTSFGQIGAATGRMSSNNPNLQNIPIRTELGNLVRRAFVAKKGCQLLGADYSQAELRVLAHLSADPGLTQAFSDGDDFHAAVSKQLGVDRRTAKAINFGIIYGLGSTALASDLGISVAEARQFIDRYFATYPRVPEFIEQMKNQAREQGYVETIFGRRRYLPDISSPNMGLKSAAERMAVNMPCQGTVADLMKLAMIRISEVLPPAAGAMLLQIHDELLFEVPTEQVKKTGTAIKEIMEDVAQLKVPLVADIKAGSNWTDMERL